MIGRFTQEDTYYEDGLNLYEYCRNNTITYKDPTGHNICATQRDLYHKYREEGMNPQEAYQKMRKDLGLDSKSGYKDSGVGNGKDPWRSYESGSKTYKNSSDITKDIRQNKPLNSPAIDAWYGKNGTISIDENGVWTYHDWEGNSVFYPNGYPDFKSAGMVRQEAPIGPFVERNKDFAKAREMGYIKSADGTWHHHEDGVTLQEVETILHDRFRHRGGISNLKKK